MMRDVGSIVPGCEKTQLSAQIKLKNNKSDSLGARNRSVSDGNDRKRHEERLPWSGADESPGMIGL
jgi:hypothetical protein